MEAHFGKRSAHLFCAAASARPNSFAYSTRWLGHKPSLGFNLPTAEPIKPMDEVCSHVLYSGFP